MAVTLGDMSKCPSNVLGDTGKEETKACGGGQSRVRLAALLG